MVGEFGRVVMFSRPNDQASENNFWSYRQLNVTKAKENFLAEMLDEHTNHNSSKKYIFR